MPDLPVSTTPTSGTTRNAFDDSPFLNQREAAALLRVSERSLERWRVEGTGPRFCCAGRRRLYRRSDIEAWAAERTYSSTSEADAA